MKRHFFYKCIDDPDCQMIFVERSNRVDGIRCPLCKGPILPIDEQEAVKEKERQKMKPLDTLVQSNNVVFISEDGIRFSLFVKGERMLTIGGGQISFGPKEAVEVTTKIVAIDLPMKRQ